MEGPADAQKLTEVYRRLGMLTEVPMDAQKVDARFCSLTNSRYCGHTES